VRIALERVDLSALNFTSAGEPARYQVVVREGQAVRGELAYDPTQISLRGLGADSLVLDALRLLLGTLLIESPREAVIEQLTGDVFSSAARLELSLAAQGLTAEPLSIQIGTVALGADAQLEGVILRVGTDGGSITIEQLQLRGFRSDGPGFSAHSASLSAQRFELGWGLELRISAARIEAPELTLTRPGRAQLTLSALTCADLTLRGPHLLLGGLQIERARLEQKLTNANPDASDERSQAPAPPAPSDAASHAKGPTPQRAFALDLLDGLSGSLQVDVQVDITIPIFGTRRASHELRLHVEEGSVDYRQLESNLAPLENALLDFSLRGHELVLERGIPLLPTRGFGKPILSWTLSPRDRALAERDRVRLALLPTFRLAGSAKSERDDDDDDEKRSKFALRKLGLNILDFSLSLAPVAVPGIALRGVTIEQLRARGSIQYHMADVDPEGVLTGEMRGLALSVEALAVGTRGFSLRKLQVARVPRWLMRFAGLTPTLLELELEEVALSQLRLS
jgi:hypothetical protein